MQMVHTAASETSRAHYSPAVIHNNIAYISGQLPLDPTNKEAAPTGTLTEQTQKALTNVENILTLCGSSKELVLRTTIYITDIAHWNEVNAIYGKFFGAHKPARTIVPTSSLHFGALIEIDVIAAIE